MSKIRKYTSLIRLQLIFSFALLYTINQPLNCDITCLRLQHRFVCLRVFVDWFRRYVLSRAVSGTWNINFLSGSRAVRVATPETCKSEQDMPFSSAEFTNQLKATNIRIRLGTI